MIKVKFTLSIGFPGAKHEEIVEMEEYCTDEDIEECYQEWCNQYLDGGWEKQ